MDHPATGPAVLVRASRTQSMDIKLDTSQPPRRGASTSTAKAEPAAARTRLHGHHQPVLHRSLFS